MSLVITHEKFPLASKKFLAYLIAQVSWTGLLLYAIYKNGGQMVPVQISMVIMQGFMQTGFILGQAALDRYVRVAQIAAGDSQSPEAPPAD